MQSVACRNAVRHQGSAEPRERKDEGTHTLEMAPTSGFVGCNVPQTKQRPVVVISNIWWWKGDLRHTHPLKRSSDGQSNSQHTGQEIISGWKYRWHAKCKQLKRSEPWIRCTCTTAEEVDMSTF